MKIGQITDLIEKIAPLSYQESYDNCGLIIGDKSSDIDSVLLCLDVTEEVIREAIDQHCQLIISHHPPVFKEIKRFSGQSLTEKLVRSAIKNDIALYAAHTNLDNSIEGVNRIICDKLGIINPSLLQPLKGGLKKLVTFVPQSHVEMVRNAIFEAGAGFIGKYDCCSFNTDGQGSFRALEGAKPFVGQLGNVHFENEVRMEFIYPAHIGHQIISAMIKSHPYEEVAFDIYPIENVNPAIGSGMIGYLPEPVDALEFLHTLKKVFKSKIIRYSKINKDKVHKIALCGGSGGFLIRAAIATHADVFITGELGYHGFFETENSIILADAGHFETEQYTIELIESIIKENFPNFAVKISNSGVNPVNYL